jgi:hypothetical protein
MSMHIVDDEQRSDRRATPMRPSGSGLEGASASLALLDDVHRHRLRRAALHLPLPSQERGPFQFSDRLLGLKGDGIDPRDCACHFPGSDLSRLQRDQGDKE